MSQTTLALVALAVIGTLALTYVHVKPVEQDIADIFISWKQEHGKLYGDADVQAYRYNIFKQNFAKIVEWNKDETKTSSVALNAFADLTAEEFASMFNGYKSEARTSPKNYVVFDTTDLPSSVDWTTQGAVTPIKNQGQCGSCWAFSTTGSLEGLHFLKKGSLLSFSEQQLVDCSQSFGNQGCNGGIMDQGFQYVKSKGVELESTYPYTAQDGQCQYEQSQTQFSNTGYSDVTPNNVDQLMAAVAQQPVSIAIEADQFPFQFYSGGVISSGCGQQLDHGVLIVGYGTQSGKDFWKVKNSWGASWGLQGFVMIERSSADVCGVLDEPSYPTL